MGGLDLAELVEDGVNVIGLSSGELGVGGPDIRAIFTGGSGFEDSEIHNSPLFALEA